MTPPVSETPAADALTDAYRDLPDADAGPSAALDRRLHAAAHAAASAPRRRARWAPPLALAASLLLAVGLTLTVQRQQSGIPGQTFRSAEPMLRSADEPQSAKTRADAFADRATLDADNAVAPAGDETMADRLPNDAEETSTRRQNAGTVLQPPAPPPALVPTPPPAAAPAPERFAGERKRQAAPAAEALSPQRSGIELRETDAPTETLGAASGGQPDADDFEPLLRLLREGRTAQAATGLRALLARYPRFPTQRLPPPLRELQRAEAAPR